MKVLITASSSSIGMAMTQKFADSGYTLVLHYHIHKPDFQAQFIQADLTQPDEVERAVKEAERYGPYDVVVNNAGINPAEDLKNLNYWEVIFRVDAIFPAILMGKGRDLVNSGGCFINISTAYGHIRFGEVNNIAYSAAKAALNSLTLTFAKKLAPNIRVNAVAPGYVESAWNENYSKEKKAELAKDALTEKLVKSVDVADLVTHLVDNKSINGEIVYIDGGLTLKTI